MGSTQQWNTPGKVYCDQKNSVSCQIIVESHPRIQGEEPERSWNVIGVGMFNDATWYVTTMVFRLRCVLHMEIREKGKKQHFDGREHF